MGTPGAPPASSRPTRVRRPPPRAMAASIPIWPIRIDPKVDRPWKRGGFRHEQLLEWARENRSRLVHAVIVLVKAWLAASRPDYSVRAGLLREMVQHHWRNHTERRHPRVSGFVRRERHTEGQEWRSFVEAWWRAFRSEPKKVAELNQLCEREDLMLVVRGDRTEKSQHSPAPRHGNVRARVAGRSRGGGNVGALPGPLGSRFRRLKSN